MMTEDYPLVFAVNSEFIKDIKGDFGNTIIMSMGCESHYLNDMAEAFTEKGASVYIGWSCVVSLKYADSATLDLFNNLLTENMTVAEGISGTMTELGYDPYFNTYLKYYPK